MLLGPGAASEKVRLAQLVSGAGLVTLCQLPLQWDLAGGRLLVERSAPTRVASAGRRWQGRDPRVRGLCCAGMNLEAVRGELVWTSVSLR